MTNVNLLEEMVEYFSAVRLFREKLLSRDGDKFILDMKALLEHNPVAHDFFLNRPEDVSRMILDSLELFQKKKIYRFKIINFSDIHPISVLRVEHMDKLVKVQGMISKTTKVVALVISRNWECPACGTMISALGPVEPKMCPCGRRGGFRTASTKFADVQEIELEELQDNLEDKQPQKIRIRFLHELCDREISGILQPGNKIEVIGVVEKTQVFKVKQKEDEELFEYRVNAYDMKSLEEKYNEEYITDEDIQQIKEIAFNKPLEQLSNSLAPSIHGHDNVKQAIVLQMAGGVKRFKADGSVVRDRSHILICGDAGTGKSHIAKCTKARMPKSYYVSGDESSKAGLVAMVDKDELLNQWCVKAGALSKANDSILVIDECDKLSDDDRGALHTPMESGEIILNKAGIHTSLKAACSILAIANPKGGMFELDNPNITLTKQINLPPTLLSRFDLIFVMTDVIDEHNDSSIVDSIYLGDKKDSVIPIELFRKYITYVRKQKPKRDPKLLDNIKKFYNKVRSQSISLDSKMKGMPITPRHIEGILRLAEAHAKLRLSEYVEESDLKVAQDLFSNSLLKLGMDESTGVFDFARVGSGQTLNKKNKFRLVIEVIKVLEEEHGKHVPYSLVKNMSLEKGINSFEFEELLSELKKSGEVIEPRNGLIQAL